MGVSANVQHEQQRQSFPRCVPVTDRRQRVNIPPAHNPNNTAGIPEIRSILNSSEVIENRITSGETIADAERIRVVYARNKTYRLLAISLGKAESITVQYIVVTLHKFLNTIHFESGESSGRKFIFIIPVNATNAFLV